MKERLEQIKHIENMISDLNKAINNANQFGDEETVKAINNQINRYRELLESLKEEELEEYNEVETNKRFESFEELRSSVRKGDIITLVETTELLNGEFTVRTYKLRVDRVNKKTVSMTNLTSDFTFKLADITNEFCYSVKREYFYTEEYDEPKEDKIKVVVKKPGDTHGQIVEIDNRLEELQSIVEGYIEVFPLTEDILIILNEEGKLQDLKPNIFVSNGEGFELIVGNIVIVGCNGEDFTSLNDKQINQLYELGILDDRHIKDILNFNKSKKGLTHCRVGPFYTVTFKKFNNLLLLSSFIFEIIFNSSIHSFLLSDPVKVSKVT